MARKSFPCPAFRRRASDTIAKQHFASVSLTTVFPHPTRDRCCSCACSCCPRSSTSDFRHRHLRKRHTTDPFHPPLQRYPNWPNGQDKLAGLIQEGGRDLPRT